LSVLFLATAIGMWCMGGYVIATFKHFNSLASAYYVSVPAGVMIFAGIIFLVGAISGFFAACRENKCCSLTFFVTVLLIFVLLITAIALSAVYRRQINQMVNNEATSALNKYNLTDDNSKSQIDYLQQYFKCCGSDNYINWTNTVIFSKQKPNSVPISCCKVNNATTCLDGKLDNMTEKNHTVSDFIFVQGCVGQVQTFLDNNLYYLAAGAIAFLVLLILAMIGSCVVLWQRKDESYFNLGN